jgi:hypothetical protein
MRLIGGSARLIRDKYPIVARVPLPGTAEYFAFVSHEPALDHAVVWADGTKKLMN